MRSWVRGLILAACGLVALGCARTGTPDMHATPKDAVAGVGTIVFMEAEGGFHAIRSDDGVTYDPRSLPDAFKTDGLRVRFTVRVIPGAVGIHQVGPIVDVLEIKRLN
jgi:hypothetical protein